jgi:hypothetical protein
MKEIRKDDEGRNVRKRSEPKLRKAGRTTQEGRKEKKWTKMKESRKDDEGGTMTEGRRRKDDEEGW